MSIILLRSLYSEQRRAIGLKLFGISGLSWLQQCVYFCFPLYVWNLLLFKAVIEHVQEPKPCGWSEELDHFMMDVIQARSFAVFEASPRSRMVKVVKMVSWLSVFSNAFLLCILPFWSGFPLSWSWWAIASGVMFGELIGYLSSPLIFERVCHRFLLLSVMSIPVIVSICVSW